MSNTVTREGQVTIPKQVCDLLGIDQGSEVSFELASDGRVVLTAGVPRPATSYARFRGAAGPGMTTDEIMMLTRGED